MNELWSLRELRAMPAGPERTEAVLLFIREHQQAIDLAQQLLNPTPMVTNWERLKGA